MTKMAKKLKKEKVNVDIVNFGEEVNKNCVVYWDLHILLPVHKNENNGGMVACCGMFLILTF